MGNRRYSWRDFEGALVLVFLTTLMTALAATTSQQDIDEMYRSDHRQFAQILHDIGAPFIVLVGGAATLALVLINIARVQNEEPRPPRPNMFQ